MSFIRPKSEGKAAAYSGNIENLGYLSARKMMLVRGLIRPVL